MAARTEKLRTAERGSLKNIYSWQVKPIDFYERLVYYKGT
jgi:hypothetical protein